MTEGWTCSRCSTANVEASLICSTCGLTRPDDEPAASPTPDLEARPGSGAVVAEGAAAVLPMTPDAMAPEEAAADGAPADGPSSEPPTASDGIQGWLSPSGQPAVEASAPAPFWRRIPVGWLVVAVIVVGVGVTGWYFNASRSSSGEITKSGDLTASDLRVGDCFDLKDPSADEVEDVTAAPCTVEHEYEVLFVGSLSEGEYPAESVFDTYVQANCRPAFDAYIGKALNDSELDIFWFYPTDDAWRSGDRSVQCAAYHPRIHRLTESLKGSKR